VEQSFDDWFAAILKAATHGNVVVTEADRPHYLAYYLDGYSPEHALEEEERLADQSA
jgi:hypothetical protein